MKKKVIKSNSNSEKFELKWIKNQAIQILEDLGQTIDCFVC